MNMVEFLKIISILISILNFLIVIIVGLGGWFAFKKITTNDLHHISSDIKDLNYAQKCTTERLIVLSDDVSYLKGKLDIKRGAVRVKKLKKGNK